MNAALTLLKAMGRAIGRGVISSEYPIFGLSCPTLGAAGDLLLMEEALVERSPGGPRDY